MIILGVTQFKYDYVWVFVALKGRELLVYSTEGLQWEEKDATENSLLGNAIRIITGAPISHEIDFVPSIEWQNHSLAVGALALSLRLPGVDLVHAVLHQLGRQVVRVVAPHSEGELVRPLLGGREEA